MKKKNKGAVLVLILLGVAVFSLLLLFQLNFFQAMVLQIKTTMAADAAALSGGRAWAEGLEGMADNWEALIPLIEEAAPSGFLVRSDKASRLETLFARLPRSLQSRSARVKSAMTVVLDANGARELLQRDVLGSFPLGLELKPVLLQLETGDAKIIPAGWIGRTELGGGKEGTHIQGIRTGREAGLFPSAANWRWSHESTVGLVWDPKSLDVTPKGGFPQQFLEGISENAFMKKPDARYKAVFVGEKGNE